ESFPIMTKRAPGSHQGWMFYVGGLIHGSEAKKPAFGVSEGADPGVVGNAEIGLNVWHHLAVAFHSSASRADLFLDGALMGSSSLPQPLATFTNLFLGRDSKTAQYFLNGRLDEVSVWSRALTADEVFILRACRLSGSEPNLISYWNFDAGTLM